MWITGQVKDCAGRPLSGVMIEVSGASLMEKTRTAMTDRQGLYTIVDLQPDVYRLTFARSGFSTVLRDGVDLSSSFVATVNPELTPSIR
jgi:hypothetical protein